MNAKIAKRGNIKTKWRAKDQNLVVLIARRDILLQIKNPSIAVNVDGVSLSKSRVRLPARIVQKAPFNFTRESSVRPMCCGFVVVVVVVVVVIVLLLGGASFKTCFNSCFIFLFQYFNIEHCT